MPRWCGASTKASVACSPGLKRAAWPPTPSSSSRVTTAATSGWTARPAGPSRAMRPPLRQRFPLRRRSPRPAARALAGGDSGRARVPRARGADGPLPHARCLARACRRPRALPRTRRRTAGTSPVAAEPGRATRPGCDVLPLPPLLPRSPSTPASAVREGAWKLIEYFEDGRAELYNLSDDPGEQHDLAARFPDRVSQLRQRLETWRQVSRRRRTDPQPRFQAAAVSVSVSLQSCWPSAAGLLR